MKDLSPVQLRDEIKRVPHVHQYFGIKAAQEHVRQRKSGIICPGPSGFGVGRYRLMVLVAQCLGLRVSEILGLYWRDFNFDSGTDLVQRSAVHGRVDSVKTEYSKYVMPLDPALAALILEWGRTSDAGDQIGWVFHNPATNRPYHQESIQKRFLKPAGDQAGIGFSFWEETGKREDFRIGGLPRSLQTP